MLSFALLTGLFLATPLSAVDIAKSRWVTSWTAMPQDTDAANMPPAAFIDTATNTTFFNTTIRQTVRVSLGGEAIRVRFANTFGTSNLVITAASIALPVSGSGSKSVHLNTSQALTFAGSTSFSVPVGGLVVSDPLEFGVAALETISVSVYLASGHPGKITSHPGSFTTSWLQWGNSIHEENLTDASVSPTPHWFLLNAVEVFAPDAASALFLVGDSITDGFGSDMDANNRWSDFLLARMQNRSTTALIAVNNQAAGGNRILSDVKGPNLVSRIDRDVLAQTGVQKYAIMFEGVNDLGKANATEEVQNAVSDALILAMKQVALRLHAAQIPVFAATIIPFGASDIRSPFREAARQKVNAFIRGSDIFEGVVDFDAVVADPESPTNIKAEYDFGDGEHLNPTGNAAVADSFPLEMFERFAGGVRRYM